MSEKVVSHSGVTRHNDNVSSMPPATTSGRFIANRVFVGNIPSNLVERDLIMLFHRFGKIRDVKIIPEHTRNKSYGFVTFYSEVDARRAIQASVQHDCVMWGDRKLNVAPAIKRSNNNNHNNSPSASLNGLRQTFGTADVHPQQALDPNSVDPGNNPMYQTAVICRLPPQYAMTQCHQYSSSSSGHYFVTPGYQPYLQNGSSVPVANNQASLQHYASYATSVTAVPLTPPGSSTSRDNSQVADVQSDGCIESSGGDSVNSSQGDAEKSAVESLGNETNNEVGQLHQIPSNNNESPYPLHTTIMCCPHHSCMLSPISSYQHLPAPAVATASLARSCLSLHGHPEAGCPYTPASPLFYSSPMVYNTARRSSARLQRWNSLDANLGHHQQQNVGWANDSSWSRPSMLDDSYGSEAGLYPGPRGFDRPLRPAFSCQSHHGGMFSPFCRSYEYNIWGQGQTPNGNVDHPDQSGSPNTSGLQMNMSVQSHSNLALNLNEAGSSEQVQLNKK